MILTMMIFVPAVAAVAILCLPREQEKLIKWISLAATALPLVLAAQLWQGFDRGAAGLQYVERAPWIAAFHIEYFLGIDGISAPMVLLTALISFICILASWNVTRGVKAYFALFLLLHTGMMGVFCALDFFLFYVFWEVMLLPMYFLIGIWGGPRREYAAIKFFLYTLLGSVLMLLGILAMYFLIDVDPKTPGVQGTFDMMKILEHREELRGNFWLAVFLGFFVAFAVKVPVFPFHTWLPDAHVEAPTPISVILAAVLLKMGVYGMLRVNFPMMPDAAHSCATLIALLGAINIVYGALCAMAQKDFKKLVAYSSVSHMGYCLLGMATAITAGADAKAAGLAVTGAAMQMFNHGTITGMLFLLVGVVYDRAHHREINGFGGLAVKMPVYAGVCTVAFMASLGLPALSGFWGEVFVFLGSFTQYRALTIISVSGVVLGAAYLLWTFQRVFLGKLNDKYKDIPEINGREMACLVPLGLITIALGIYPAPLIDLMKASLDRFVTFF